MGGTNATQPYHVKVWFNVEGAEEGPIMSAIHAFYISLPRPDILQRFS